MAKKEKESPMMTTANTFVKTPQPQVKEEKEEEKFNVEFLKEATHVFGNNHFKVGDKAKFTKEQIEHLKKTNHVKEI